MFRRLFQRFKKGLEVVVDVITGGVFVEGYKLAKKAVHYAAPKISAALKSTAGQVCAYIKTTAVPSLSSPFCILQTANLYAVAAVGVVAGLALAVYAIGAIATA
jgi:hypothetical protein